MLYFQMYPFISNNQKGKYCFFPLSLQTLSFGIDTEVYYILNVIVKHQCLLERKGEKNSKLNLVTEAEKKKDQL